MAFGDNTRWLGSFSALDSLTVVGFSLFLGLVATGCGSSQTEPQTAKVAEEEAPEEDISDEEAALLAQIEESAAIADEAATDADGAEPPQDNGEDDGPAAREVVYRVSQDSLKVQIGDSEFIPKAVAVRASGGGWGVKLTVTASSNSEKVLWSSPNGPLAFGGSVIRGTREKITDTRGGGNDIQLSPGAPIEFDRTWPPKGEKGIASGDELELHIGLWGYGNSADDRRPVNRFLTIKMRGGGKNPKPMVMPPG